ncbi:MAG: hypothetical protein J6J86_02825 [Lachnospiraceae bacterium]|nr:hypothetical protein [Lachnospiraceae bacterium]
MDKIGVYNIFQNSMYENTAVKKETAAEKASAKKTESVKKESTAGVNKAKHVELSDRAKDLLEELKKKYTNMDFMVADYETEEEAAQYLSRGTKEFSVLIDPETLEQMAADEEVKNKYMAVMDESQATLKGMLEELDDEEEEQVKRVGISIDKDGTVSYFAELERASAKQKERIEKSREEKIKEAEKAEKEEKAEKQEELLKSLGEKRKKAFVQADSVEELLEKIRNVDWNAVEAEEVKQMGGKIDFTA